MIASLFSNLSDAKRQVDERAFERLMPLMSVIPDVIKVGAEGYIHGFICVRPPCGDKPDKLKTADLSVKRDGTVVHKPSGYSVGRVDRGITGKYTATHSDGHTSSHKDRETAVRTLAGHFNSGKTQREDGVKPPKKTIGTPANHVEDVVSDKVEPDHFSILSNDPAIQQQFTSLPEDEQKIVGKHLPKAEEALNNSSPTLAYHHLYLASQAWHVNNKDTPIGLRRSQAFKLSNSIKYDGIPGPGASKRMTLSEPKRVADNPDAPFGKLSNPEKYLLKDYERPRSGGADYFNPALRRGDGSYLSGVSGDIGILDSAIAKSWARQDTTVYRGMSAPADFELKPGMKFTDKAFGSTTESKEEATNFAYARAGQLQPGQTESPLVDLKITPGTPRVMKITIPRGYNMVNGDKGVQEHILPRGTTYRVDSVDADGTVNLSVVMPDNDV